MKYFGLFLLICSVYVLAPHTAAAARLCTCDFTIKAGAADVGNVFFKQQCQNGLSGGVTCESCESGSTTCHALFESDQAACDAAGKEGAFTKSLGWDVPGAPNASTATCVLQKEGYQPDAAPGGPGSAPAPSQALKPVVLTDPMGGKGIVGAIASLVSTFLGMVGAIALLVFVYAGVIYMTAGGAEDRVKHAKDTMQYALIGLALITFAYALANFYFTALTT